MRKSQTSLEYVLIIAGVLILVVVVSLVLRGGVVSPGIEQSEEQLKEYCGQRLVLDQGCYQDGRWHRDGEPRDARIARQCGEWNQLLQKCVCGDRNTVYDRNECVPPG